jgi:hypothetical protein
MPENKLIYSCCKNGKPIFLIHFSVAGEQKLYRVCKFCESLEYFQKFVIQKEEL